jgi:hypothetical protein
MITDSTLLIRFEVHHKSTDGSSDGDETIECQYLIGPCPARSAVLVIRERMMSINLRTRLQNEFFRQQQSTLQPFSSLQPARDLMMDLSLSIKESLRAVSLIAEKYFQYLQRRTRRRSLSQSYDDMTPSPSRDHRSSSSSQSSSPTLLSHYHELFYSPQVAYSQLLSFHLYRLLKELFLIVLLLKETSTNHQLDRSSSSSSTSSTTPTAPSDSSHESHHLFTIEGIQRHMNENTLFYQYHCFDSKSIQQYGTSMATAVKSPNIQKMKEFLKLFENYLFDLILLGWRTFSTTGGSMTAPVLPHSTPSSSSSSSSSSHRLSLLLDHLINGYFNRIVSLIGQCMMSFHSSTLTPQSSITLNTQLEFFYFLISSDSQFAHTTLDTLHLFGFDLNPRPTFSLIFNLDQTLTHLPEMISLEIHNMIKNTISFHYKSSNDMNIFPWTISHTSTSGMKGGGGNDSKGLLEGPFPDLVFNILMSYIKIISQNTESAPFDLLQNQLPSSLGHGAGSGGHHHSSSLLHEQRYQKMNDIISIQCIQSYRILLTIYEKILFNLKRYLNDEITSSPSPSHSSTRQPSLDREPPSPSLPPPPSSSSSSSLTITEDDYYLSNILNYDFHNTALSSLLFFLCSICNDTHHILHSHFYLLSSHITSHPSNEYRHLITQIELKFAYIAMIALDTMTHIIFQEINDLFHDNYHQVWVTQHSPVETALNHLASFLDDFLTSLEHDSYDQLVISCCRKIIKLYFLMLSSHSDEIQRENQHRRLLRHRRQGYNRTNHRQGSTSTRMTLSIFQRIPSFNPFTKETVPVSVSREEGSGEEEGEDERSLKFSYFHLEQMREDVERIATFCIRHSYSKSTNLLHESEELLTQFNLMNVSPSKRQRGQQGSVLMLESVW